MRNHQLLVSIVIPTKNSAAFLFGCLRSIGQQTYKNIEVLIVDSGSTDRTLEFAKKYHCIVYHHTPNLKLGMFDAPRKRNYGIKKAKGEYVYYLDADMELQNHVVAEAVDLCQSGYQAAIVTENSVGTGIWARAKNLERQCYWGDDTVEAPRFFPKKVWQELGGLDESIGGGGDDWDLYQKLLERGYKSGRTKNMVFHHEGHLSLKGLFWKRFMYGRESLRYIVKRPVAGIVSYFPIRKSYLRNWRLFIKRPVDTLAFIVLRTIEYLGGFVGILYSLIVS
ncbi:MAG: glycosyltransferase [Candidatus Woesebacteria bacterium]|nr:glycosyltransferase [Candidatus Woesebacteria bacterium]